MSTKEVADKLVAYCRKGDFNDAQAKLYADDAVSIEPQATPGFEKETKGLDAIKKKSEKFDSMVDTSHGIKISEPLVAGNTFAFTLEMDITMKGKGRMNMSELCVYHVKDGKIVREEFMM